MQNCLCWICQLLCWLCKQCEECDNCPDGVCAPVLAEGGELQAKLQSPNLKVAGIFDAIRLVRCIPVADVIELVKRVGGLLRDCDKCPDGDCSFLDLLACLDLEEMVACVQEAFRIIRESKFCIDGDNEITVGAAAA